MRSLDTAREVCEQYHPGLCARLADIPLLDRESAGSPVIKLFRDHGGPGLLVPSEYSGSGADALEAVRVMRAVASYSPSLGAAVTMHHFTMAMLFSLAQTAARLTLSQLELMSRIAPQRLLVASGWAESTPSRCCSSRQTRPASRSTRSGTPGCWPARRATRSGWTTCSCRRTW